MKINLELKKQNNLKLYKMLQDWGKLGEVYTGPPCTFCGGVGNGKLPVNLYHLKKKKKFFKNGKNFHQDNHLR